MLSKEEYQKNLRRMFDSLRTEHKGEDNCAGVKCAECPFKEVSCSLGASNFYLFETMEIVENWSKEHPVMTNADKFRELFGVQPPINACVNNNIDCENCGYYSDGRCNVHSFWDKEYVWPMLMIL